MGLIRKPSQIEPKQATSVLIYGQPGMGKTTLACSSDFPVLLDYDDGVNRIHSAHSVDTVQIKSWTETKQALEEIKEAGCYKTIVIDTVGKMLDMIVAFIKETQPRLVQNDGTLQQKGYGLRKNLFSQFIKDVTAVGIDVVFVGHEKEEKSNGDLVVKRCDAGSNSNANDLFKDLELVGYVSAHGEKRTIDFKGSDIIFAKAPTFMQKCYDIPVVVDKNGNASANTFMRSTIMNEYRGFQETNRKMREDFEKLKKEILEKVEAIENAAEANEFVEWFKNQPLIFDSRALGLNSIMNHTKSKNIGYDCKTKLFFDITNEDTQAQEKRNKRTRKVDVQEENPSQEQAECGKNE